MTSHTSPAPVRPTRRRRRAVTALAVAATLALALAACGGDDDDAAATDDDTAETTSGDAAAAPADDGYGTRAPAEDSEDAAAAGGDAVPYEVTGIEYSDVSAPAGGTIEITNSSGAPHTFTADDGAFDVSYDAGESATVEVPAEPGEYGFHCEVHSSMQATVTVE
ncbi:MAG TPA: cupredoxin domain-containing protein [Acidimicrobiales bacterium]|nr:cupredoxin domain-containing protein [Acidimicrobiales bacterium]